MMCEAGLRVRRCGVTPCMSNNQAGTELGRRQHADLAPNAAALKGNGAVHTVRDAHKAPLRHMRQYLGFRARPARHPSLLTISMMPGLRGSPRPRAPRRSESRLPESRPGRRQPWSC